MKPPAIHQHAVKVLARTPRLKMAKSGTRTSRCSSRWRRRFSTHIGGSLTNLRTYSTAKAGNTPIHNMPRQPI